MHFKNLKVIRHGLSGQCCKNKPFSTTVISTTVLSFGFSVESNAIRRSINSIKFRFVCLRKFQYLRCSSVTAVFMTTTATTTTTTTTTKTTCQATRSSFDHNDSKHMKCDVNDQNFAKISAQYQPLHYSNIFDH